MRGVTPIECDIKKLNSTLYTLHVEGFLIAPKLLAESSYIVVLLGFSFRFLALFRFTFVHTAKLKLSNFQSDRTVCALDVLSHFP